MGNDDDLYFFMMYAANKTERESLEDIPVNAFLIKRPHLRVFYNLFN